MSGMWKRSHGRTSEAPPDERGGYRYVRPTATAPHLDSTHLVRCYGAPRRSLNRTDSRHSSLSVETGPSAPRGLELAPTELTHITISAGYSNSDRREAHRNPANA